MQQAAASLTVRQTGEGGGEHELPVQMLAMQCIPIAVDAKVEEIFNNLL